MYVDARFLRDVQHYGLRHVLLKALCGYGYVVSAAGKSGHYVGTVAVSGGGACEAACRVADNDISAGDCRARLIRDGAADVSGILSGHE